MSNPFFVLNVSPAANQAEIALAFDDALADGLDTDEVLREARRQLLTPKLRLAAELSFFPDATDADRSATMEALRNDSSYSELLPLTRILPPASRANYLAHIGAEYPSAGVLRALAVALAQIDSAAIEDSISAVHAIAGIPAPAPGAVDDGLDAVSRSNAETLFSSYDIATAARDFRAFLEAELVKASPSSVRALTVLADAYGKAAGPSAEKLRREIESTTDALLASPRDASALERIDGALRHWDDLAQPQQLLSLYKGRDEPTSRSLFEFLRGVMLELANERDEPATALALCEACKMVFAELPRATEQLKEDSVALQGLVHQAGASQLAQFINTMKTDLDSLVTSLKASGYDANSSAPAGQLYRFMDQSIRATAGTSAAELPWFLVRTVALELNNDRGDPISGGLLIDGIVSHPLFGAAPQAVRTSIEADARTINANRLQARLNQAIQSKDRSDARRILAELVAITPEGAERTSFSTALKTLEAERQRTIVGYLVWAAIAVGVIFFASQSNHASYSSYPTYPTFSTPQAGPAAPDHQQPTPTTTRPPLSSFFDTTTETKPPVGSGLALNRDNIRYCLYNNARLAEIRRLLEYETNNNVIDDFNNAIEDYNARCGSYQYYQEDQSAVESEVMAKQAQFSADALRIVVGWRSSQ